MQFLKSLGDGIGTAAGVAWPTFGIVSASLGLAIGSGPAFLLGAALSGVFLIVAIPVAYWSQKNFLEEKHALKNSMIDQENKLHEIIFNYLCKVAEHYRYLKEYNLTKRNFLEYMRHAIRKDLRYCNMKNSLAVIIFNDLLNSTDSDSLLEKFCNSISSQNHTSTSGVSFNFTKENTKEIKKYLHSYYQKQSLLPEPVVKSYGPAIKSGLTAFYGAFGSFAGCFAGVSGLLMGLGIFAGLSSIPPLGGIVIIGALIFGGIVATNCFYQSLQKEKLTQLVQQSTNLNNDITHCHIMRHHQISSLKRTNKYFQKQAPLVKPTHEPKPITSTAKRPEIVVLPASHDKRRNFYIWQPRIPKSVNNNNNSAYRYPIGCH